MYILFAFYFLQDYMSSLPREIIFLEKKETFLLKQSNIDRRNKYLYKLYKRISCKLNNVQCTNI